MNLGIAVITYSRPDYLENLLDSLYAFDLLNSEVVVFDDASNDGTQEVSNKYTSCITQKTNNGVVCNKNTALYYFSEVSPKDYIIILEDDVVITQSNWINSWVEAAEIYGHMNFTPEWFLDENHIKYHVCGDGSLWSPDVFSILTGQCTSIKTELMKNSVGYLDPRFKGFGYGHVEWTNRFVDKGYGGFVLDKSNYYYSLRFGIHAPQVASGKNEEQFKANAILYNNLKSSEHDRFFNKPWISEADRISFLKPFTSISHRI
jgi:glycosyltransferase involved in cell wall biosynthesis